MIYVKANEHGNWKVIPINLTGWMRIAVYWIY
jgi:hypothetical protein